MATEKRLIDANAAVELLRGLGSRDYRREKGTIMDAMKMLSYPDYTHTVDAVEVVRCKDCKFYMAETEERCIALKANPFGWCLRHRQLREADHREIRDANAFCSYGERRTDD